MPHLVFAGYTPTPTPTKRPTPTPRLTSSPRPTSTPRMTATPRDERRDEDLTDVECDEVRVSGDNRTAPQTVVIVTILNDPNVKVSRYRYNFGDGEKVDGGNEIRHTYQQGGNYTVVVEVQNKDGEWVRDSSCKTRVRLISAPLTSNKTECTEIIVFTDEPVGVGDTVEMQVAGYDTQGDVSSYRIDYGDGETDTDSNGEFRHTYDETGTYTVQGAIRDKDGEWHEDRACRTSVRVGNVTTRLTSQPDTGPELWMTASGLLSLVTGIGLRRRLRG